MIPMLSGALHRTVFATSAPVCRTCRCRGKHAFPVGAWTIAVGSLVLTFSPSTSDAQEWTPIGTVTWHNGRADSSPAGSGAVDVSLAYPHLVCGPYQGVYSEVATHEVHLAYSATSPTLLYNRSYIVNDTQVSWTGFQVLLIGADFAGWELDHPLQARLHDPVADWGFNPDFSALPVDDIGLLHWTYMGERKFTLAGSTITRFNDQGSGFRDSLLNVVFDTPVPPTKGFALWYNIIPSPGAAGEPGFTTCLTPIPEPASLILAALGATATLLRRRRTV